MKYILIFIAFVAISGTAVYQGVRHDATMTGSGITGDELKADTTTYLATAYDISRLVSAAGTVNETIGGLKTFSTPPSIPTQTPATAAATGTTGQIAWDASYVYICTATNTWKRVAIATW